MKPTPAKAVTATKVDSGREEFCLYIVESPRADDFYHDRSEGALIEKAIRLGRNSAVTRTVLNKKMFSYAVSEGLPKFSKENEGSLPALHISAHGDRKGIQFSDETTMDWDELKAILTPVNHALNSKLLLCMSACEGYFANVMAMSDGDESHPYFATVGHAGKPTWAETAVGYAAFYHLVSTGKHLEDAVLGMRAASGSDGWVFRTSQAVRKNWQKKAGS